MFCSVQFRLLVMSYSATPWTAKPQASLSITNSRSLLKLMSVESVMPSNHLILCHPLLLPPSIFPSIRVFSNESVLRIRWPKYCSSSFSISPSSEYSELISFRMDRLDLLAVQGTLKSLLHRHSSKASILQCSVFFMVQLSTPYLTSSLMEYIEISFSKLLLNNRPKKTGRLGNGILNSSSAYLWIIAHPLSAYCFGCCHYNSRAEQLQQKPKAYKSEVLTIWNFM